MIWVALVPAAVGAGWLLGQGDAAANARAAAESARVDLLLALQGVTAGLFARERIRLRRTHASPTLAFLGKRLLLGSLAAAAVFVFSPVDWPPGCLDAFGGASGLGLCLWLGNLPAKL